jgi:glycosyltransferase involved in cell wall biosynthesis
MQSKIPCIIIVTPGFPENENDSTCIPFLQQFVISLKRNFSELKFIVITLHYPYSKMEYVWNGIDIYSIGGKNKAHIFAYYTRTRVYKKLYELQKSYSIVGVLSLWCTDAALVSQKFCSKKNIKHFIWIVGQDAKANNKYVSKISPQADQLIAFSDFLQAEFFANHQLFPNHIISNGINADSFEALNTGEREIDIFGAGNLTPLKNYTLFIEVIYEVCKTYPNLKAKIAGRGEQKSELQELILQYNLDKNIELLGEKTYSDTLKLMNRSKLFLHTSSYEGNSTVLMEALFSGCLVISSQSLSNNTIENLHVKKNKEDLVNCVLQFIKQNKPRERITFNSMDNSAKKVMKLFN